MDQWSHEQRALYDSLSDNIFYRNDAEAQSQFDRTFFTGLRGIEFEYSLDQLEMYVWQNYVFEIDDDFWEAYAEWYESTH